MRRAEPVAGLGGILLLVSLFLPWSGIGIRTRGSAGIGLRYGAWVALAGALIAWVGSRLSLRDESTPGAPAPGIPRRPAPAAG
jgi:hypothetical protein